MRRLSSHCTRRLIAGRAFALTSVLMQRNGPPPPSGGRVPPELRAPPGKGVPPKAAEAQEEAPEDYTPVKPSEPPKMLKYSHDAKGICTIELSRAPVNSLNLEFFTELNQWLLWLGSDEQTKAIIITSAIPLVFSAGLDINELNNPQDERLVQFWSQFQEMWLILNTFPKPLIAAINGNAPAGGCIISIACDYRVMARSPKQHPEKSFRIGLNETKLGIVAPPWVMAGFAYTVGTRKAERMLQLGETPTAEEALTLGLVDAVVDEDAVLDTARKEAEKFLAIPNQARWMSRDLMRQEVLQFLRGEEERQYDVQFFQQFVKNPDVQKNIAGYLARLGGSKKK